MVREKKMKLHANLNCRIEKSRHKSIINYKLVMGRSPGIDLKVQENVWWGSHQWEKCKKMYSYLWGLPWEKIRSMIHIISHLSSEWINWRVWNTNLILRRENYQLASNHAYIIIEWEISWAVHGTTIGSYYISSKCVQVPKEEHKGQSENIVLSTKLS